MVNLVLSKMERYGAEYSHILKPRKLGNGDLLHQDAQCVANPSAVDDASTTAFDSLNESSPTAVDPLAHVTNLSTAAFSNEASPPPINCLSHDVSPPAINSSTDALEKDAIISRYNILKNDVHIVIQYLAQMAIFSDVAKQATDDGLNPAVSSLASGKLVELSEAVTASRILALELIMSIFNNSGAILLNDDSLVALVRQNMTLAISSNAITTNPNLFELSLSVFLLIVRLYRHKLKLEVEIILVNVYIHILEMGNSTFQQKSLVLQGLEKICENPQV